MQFFAEALSLKAKIERERVGFAQDVLTLAFTLLDFAKITQQPETRQRSINNARKAHSEVTRLLAVGLDCDEWDRAHLESSLSRLAERLDEETVTPSVRAVRVKRTREQAG